MISNSISKIIKGTAWSVVQKFGGMLVTFVSSMILARLLSPDDYGCIGMLMIFVTISQTFVEGGFASALIQKHNPTQIDLSTVFFWNILFSLVLYFVLYFSSPLISSFYDLPLLGNLIKVMGLSLVINSFSIVQVAIMQIELKFKQLAIREIASNLLSVILTVFLAFRGYGVWALVAQIVSVGLFKSIILWYTCNWRPSCVFSIKSLISLLSFGGFMFLTNILNAFGNNIQGLLIGKFATATNMGFYSQAKKLSDVASGSFLGVVEQVAFPVMSGYNANNPENTKKVLSKYIKIVSFTIIPIFFTLIILSEPIICIVYSNKWIPVVPYFKLLCVVALFISLQSIIQTSLAAHGDSKWLFYISLLKRFVELALMFYGLLAIGIMGLLLGMVISSILSLAVNVILAQKKIGYNFINMIKDLSPCLILAIVSFIFDLYIGTIWTFGMTSYYVFSFSIFLIFYIGGSYILKLEAMEYIFKIIKNF